MWCMVCVWVRDSVLLYVCIHTHSHIQHTNMYPTPLDLSHPHHTVHVPLPLTVFVIFRISMATCRALHVPCVLSAHTYSPPTHTVHMTRNFGIQFDSVRSQLMHPHRRHVQEYPGSPFVDIAIHNFDLTAGMASVCVCVCVCVCV